LVATNEIRCAGLGVDPRAPSPGIMVGAEALLTKPIDFETLRTEIDMRVECAA